uniref:Ubiquitin carboxyl-terminal hydrolase n=1 Tax=Marseillevirus LCMAC102 TaxID=2506603 RepID=A0A481YTD2_9VIRU|nr:MAG: ubiquitin carboxyl-terminal hydrolase [Marseillevirus LCMAC102]
MERIRKIIHDSLKERFQSGDLAGLNGKDIKYAFGLYDKLVFNNQINKKLENENSSLRFFAKSKISGVGGFCGIKSKTSNILCEYYIDIAPNIINKICHIKSARSTLKKMIGADIDMVYCFQLILEHEIIHLLMILWKYLHKKSTGPKAYIYTEHGKLFQCMLDYYFGHTIFDHDLGLSEKISYGYRTPSPGISKLGLMKNWSSSCYLDSLITALFIGASNFYRNAIFNIDIDQIDYKGWAPEELGKPSSQRKKRVFKKVCRDLSKIDTELQTRDLAKRLQIQLYADYNRIIHTKENFCCTDLRHLFLQCVPELAQFKRYTEYNVSEIYDILTEIFPSLKLQDIPAIIKLPGNPPSQGVIEDKTMFQMWDFMEPTKKEGTTPIWGNVVSPVLVFQNGLIPPIHYYGSTKPEKIQTQGPIPGKYTHIYRVIEGERKRIRVPKMGEIVTIQTKAQAFGEYIINNRYRLFAAVMVYGPRPQFAEWGGGHYSAYIRPKFDPDEWYLYDDMGPMFHAIESLPTSVFKDARFQRPELLFYQKV